MIQQFDQFQKFGQDNVDATVKAFGAVSKGAQVIAVESADYAKKRHRIEHEFECKTDAGTRHPAIGQNRAFVSGD